MVGTRGRTTAHVSSQLIWCCSAQAASLLAAQFTPLIALTLLLVEQALRAHTIAVCRTIVVAVQTRPTAARVDAHA